MDALRDYSRRKCFWIDFWLWMYTAQTGYFLPEWEVRRSTQPKLVLFCLIMKAEAILSPFVALNIKTFHFSNLLQYLLPWMISMKFSWSFSFWSLSFCSRPLCWKREKFDFDWLGVQLSAVMRTKYLDLMALAINDSTVCIPWALRHLRICEHLKHRLWFIFTHTEVREASPKHLRFEPQLRKRAVNAVNNLVCVHLCRVWPIWGDQLCVIAAHTISISEAARTRTVLAVAQNWTRFRMINAPSLWRFAGNRGAGSRCPGCGGVQTNDCWQHSCRQLWGLLK